MYCIHKHEYSDMWVPSDLKKINYILMKLFYQLNSIFLSSRLQNPDV